MIHLKKSNCKIAATTLRHHLNILKKNGLIKISKTREVKGTLVKYYKSTIKSLFFDILSFDSVVTENISIINSLYPKFYKIINELFVEEQNLLSNLSKSKTICKICKTNHYMEFLLFLIFSVVISKVLDKILKKQK